MNGPYRFFIWITALVGAALPFATLWFFLPEETLGAASASGLIEIPDKLVPEFAFIGVAIFISCLPDWLSDEHFRTFKRPRRNWLIGLRSACTVCAVISFLFYIRIVLNINGVIDKKFKFNLEGNKIALFALVVAVCLTSLAAVLFHLGPPKEAST
jgi:hypothetical protein